MKKLVGAFAILLALGSIHLLAGTGDLNRTNPKETSKEVEKGNPKELPKELPKEKESKELKTVPPQSIEKCKEEVHSLKKEINFLNLINGLFLREDQLQQLLTYARELEGIAIRLGLTEKKREMAPEDKEEQVKLLDQIKTCLLKGEPVPGNIKNQYSQLQKKYPNYSYAEAQEEYREEMKIREEKAQAILTQAQLDVLATYKACLIPPRDLKNPIRIGQADSNDHSYNALKKIRQLSDWEYDFTEISLVNDFIKEHEHHYGKFNAQERESVKAQVLKTIRSARNMSNLEFELKKNKLAESLKLVKKVELLQEELKGLASKGKYVPGKIAQFLLNPGAIPVYEKRIALLKTRDMTQEDLNKLQNANQCDKGCSVVKEKK